MSQLLFQKYINQLSMSYRYVANIDKIIDEAPSDPTQDFKTQVWVFGEIIMCILVRFLVGYLITLDIKPSVRNRE